MEPVNIETTLVCSGQIREIKKEKSYYWVSLIGDPIKSFGAVGCSLIYSPGSKENYHKDDYVKVLVTVNYNVTDHKIDNVVVSAKHYIMGLLDKPVIFPLSTGQSHLKAPKDYSYGNKYDDAGMVVSDTGEVILSGMGAIKQVMKAFGFGTNENAQYNYFQNYHRVISHDTKFAAREYFGLYKGKDQEDKNSRVDGKDAYICYKRFVPQSRKVGSWVSSCEGTYNPWLGPNNEVDTVASSKEVLYSKIINCGSGVTAKRVTIEAGEPGSTFYNFRVDGVVLNEAFLPTGKGVITSILGNKFNVKISDAGAIEVRAASKGIPTSNFSGFTFKVDEDGNLSVYSKGTITIGHSETENSVCSIKFDTSSGIEINAKGGLKVNGKPVASEAFVTSFVNNLPAMFVCASPGSPAVPNPKFLAAMQLGTIAATSDASLGGFSTSGLVVKPPTTGLQPYSDDFVSV